MWLMICFSGQLLSGLLSAFQEVSCTRQNSFQGEMLDVCDFHYGPDSPLAGWIDCQGEMVTI